MHSIYGATRCGSTYSLLDYMSYGSAVSVNKCVRMGSVVSLMMKGIAGCDIDNLYDSLDEFEQKGRSSDVSCY